MVDEIKSSSVPTFRLRAWLPRHVCCVAVRLAVLSACCTCAAMGPEYETDFQISRYPIVVVATFDKAPFINHDLVEGNVRREWEVFTELNVLRVIRGDVSVGRHRIMFGWGVGWQADGTGLASWTSTHIEGDVDDLTKPSLWFLDRKPSWDTSDKTLYLHIPHYRAIQPPVLEPYFLALTRRSRDRDVPAFLADRDPLVVMRALRYVCGEIWPWPFGPSDWDTLGYTEPKQRERLLLDAAPAVSTVIDGPHEDLRANALAVYAELTRDQCIDRCRQLLSDRNPSVRVVAAGLLVRAKDRRSVAAMAGAARDLRDPFLARRLVEVIRAWRELRAAPALITLLDNESGWAVITARDALHELTGAWFPCCAATAREAWSAVTNMDDEQKMRARLAELLSEPECPVTAEAVGLPRMAAPTSALSSLPTPDSAQSEDRFVQAPGDDDAYTTVRIRNVSGHAVTVAKSPSRVVARWSSGSADCAVGPRPGRQTSADFVSLAAGATMDLEIVVDGSFLRAEPRERSLELQYAQFPPARPQDCWVGKVAVRFGALWNHSSPEPIDK